MGRMVIDTLALSRRLQSYEGMTRDDADALAHDLMFGVLAAEHGADVDQLAAMIAPLAAPRLDFRLSLLRATPADFAAVTRSLHGEGDADARSI